MKRKTSPNWDCSWEIEMNNFSTEHVRMTQGINEFSVHSGGAQLAVDTALVSVLHCDGSPRRGAAEEWGWEWEGEGGVEGGLKPNHLWFEGRSKPNPLWFQPSLNPFGETCKEEARFQFRIGGRFESFVRRDWGSLIMASRTCTSQATSLRQRRSQRGQDSLERRAERAEALVHMGELSSARQALEGAELAPGSRHTLDMLQDEAKRPRQPRVPIPPAFANLEPQVGFPLDGDRLIRNLRSERKCRRAIGHDGGTSSPTP